jgi:hypothetical protein
MEGRADRHKDMTKLTVATRNLVNAPESKRRVKQMDEMHRHIPALYS